MSGGAERDPEKRLTCARCRARCDRPRTNFCNACWRVMLLQDGHRLHDSERPQVGGWRYRLAWLRFRLSGGPLSYVRWLEAVEDFGGL